MNKIIALFGKPGSGKSFAAEKISKELNYIMFSIDKIMLKLFGDIDGRELFEEKNKLCIELIFEICDDILEKTNGNIVFDFGFWKKADRNSFKERYKKYKVIFVHMNTDDDTCWERIEKRNTENKEGIYNFDKDTFKFLSSLFEEFTEDEEYILFENVEKLIEEIRD